MDPSGAALLVIDVQEKLFARMHDKEGLRRAVLQAVQGAIALDLPIVWAEQYPAGMGPTIPELDSLLRQAGRAPLAKKTFSCLAHPEIEAAVRACGAERWLLAGIETHVCVFQTARDLVAAGYRVEVLADACSSRRPADREAGLRRIEQEGGLRASVEMALFDLLGAAEGPAFKRVLSIVK
ncbi:MAG: isochorismatase family protein [Deltaproteobacteria bacterium]|nr:isochorismatase family protein [Deltaproteobacteria bacterium]